MRLSFLMALLPLVSGLAQSIESAPQELVRLAFEADERNQTLAEQYAYREYVEERRLDKQGNIKGTKTKTYDVAHLCGRDYQRLILQDGKPLSPRENAKEQQKLDRCIEKLREESPNERSKRLRKEQEDLEEQHKLRREVLSAFDFTVEGEEVINGEPVWRIRGEPRADYEPEFSKARFLSKLAGTIWISKNDYGWVKTEVDTIEPVRFGLFLLTLKEGSRMEFTQTKVNGELWMMDQFRLRFNARALIKGLQREILAHWSDFKKFSAESRLID